MQIKSRFLVVLAACCGTAAAAQTPSDVSDLVGARGAGGETALQTRGYVYVRGETGDDRKWTYWWNPRTRTCLTVATMDGRYSSITTSPAPDCNQNAGAATTTPARPTQNPVSGPSDSRWFDLGLVCFGEGQRPTLATRYGYTWDYDRGRYTYGNRTELSTQDFDASVILQFWDGGGRIRLPNKLIPPIHSRGDHGWWELDDVSMSSDTIRAQYRVNGLNKPTIVIDRRSGHISIRGIADYGFSGTCDSADNQERRF